MPRLAVAFVFLFFAVGVLAQTKPSTDPFAVSLAQKSVAALSGGAAVSDVTLNANVISILGSDTETGTGTFEAKGTTESRVDLMLTSAVRTDVRNVANTIPAGSWINVANTIPAGSWIKDAGIPTAYCQSSNGCAAWGTGMLLVLSTHAGMVNGAHQVQHPIPLLLSIETT